MNILPTMGLFGPNLVGAMLLEVGGENILFTALQVHNFFVYSVTGKQFLHKKLSFNCARP